MDLRFTTLANGVESRRVALSKRKQKVHINGALIRCMCAARRRRLACFRVHSFSRAANIWTIFVRASSCSATNEMTTPSGGGASGHATPPRARPRRAAEDDTPHDRDRPRQAPRRDAHPRLSTSATATSARPRTSTARARSKDLVVSSRRTHTFSPRSRTKAGRTTSDRT